MTAILNLAMDALTNVSANPDGSAPQQAQQPAAVSAHAGHKHHSVATVNWMPMKAAMTPTQEVEMVVHQLAPLREDSPVAELLVVFPLALCCR